MSKSDQPIGIFDSGIGGLTVLRALRQRLPHERFVYLGDTARYPYGPKSAETIVRYSLECAAFLREQEVKLIVVACNTASSYSLASLESSLPIPVIGTVRQASEDAIRATRNGKIGVIGTEATIRSLVYQNLLHSADASFEVFARACPLFVPFVEQGIFSGKLIEQVVDFHLSDLRNKEIDTLLLGCTHYPLLREVLAGYFQHSVSIVDCAASISEQVARTLQEQDLMSQYDAPQTEYFVTDDKDRFNALARLFLKSSDVNAKNVELHAL